MTEEDLEIIPTLNDIVVTGDLSKAVVDNNAPDIHDANVQDLASTEHFTATFEPLSDTTQDSDDDIAYIAGAALSSEAVIDETDNVTNESAEQSAQDDALTEENFDNDETSSDALIDTHDNDEFSPDIGNITAAAEPRDTVDSKSDMQASPIAHRDIPSGEIVDGILLTETSELTVTNDLKQLNQDQSIAEDTDDDNLKTSAKENLPQIDIDHLVENIMQEMMPHLEVQIRAQILSSLAKHLPESIIIYDDEPDFEKDQNA